MNVNQNLPNHFWDQVDKTDTCWLWIGTKNKPNGYGWFYFNKKQHLAHRLVCGDPIPPGACVLHTCDNPACVNPDHLFFGSKKDNALDAVSKNRDAAFRRAKLTPEAVARIRALPRTVEVARELAAEYGVSASHITGVQNHHFYKRVDTGPKPFFEKESRKGEKAGNAKITEADVHAIRRAPRKHGNISRLAKEYGLTPSAVQAIITGRTWSYLPWEEGVVPHTNFPPKAPVAPEKKALLAARTRRRARRKARLSP